MTDGPFRNAELSNYWKRYGDQLVNDATSVKERAMQVCHAMMDDAGIEEFTLLFNDLKAHVDRPQLELDAINAIEAIFDARPPSLLGDSLQRHLMANLREQATPNDALNQALGGAAREWVGTAKNRLDEECIRARDIGDMSQKSYRLGIERNQEAFAAINPGDLRDALASGNKYAFKHAVQKKRDVDEGPDD